MDWVIQRREIRDGGASDWMEYTVDRVIQKREIRNGGGRKDE